MSEQKQKIFDFLRFFFKNTFSFLMMFLFINAFSLVFGSANILAGVAVAVAFTTIPSCNFGIKPPLMAILITAIFFGIGIASALSVVNPWLGFLINLIFIFSIMIISCKPIIMKPYISFLIAYIFCQTTPVEGKDLLLRIVGLTLGGIATSISYLLSRKKESFKPYAFAKQVQSGFIQYKFVFRMTVGIACAMLLAALLHLQKPLWISIVVMSLTQLEIKDTIERIHHRTIATVFGVILFVLLFRVLIPPEYDVLLILFSGYLSTFLSQYKYKQIINAISAINASLVLMDTSTAVINRFLCLLVGIAIVLGLFLLEKTATQYHHKIQLRN